MSFQTRIFLTYFILIILLITLIGMIYFRYSADLIQNNACSNLSFITDKMSQQLDNLIRPMDFISTSLISSGSFMSSMATLASLSGVNSENMVFINEGMQTIYSTLLTYAIDKNFHRVSVLNDKGYFISSNFRYDNTSKDSLKQVNSLPWIKDADNADGKAIIIPPYIDPWASGDKISVFGLARSVKGSKGKIGYIEVQNRFEELEKIFSVPNEDSIKVIAVIGSGDLFYNNCVADSGLLQYYTNRANTIEKPVLVERNSVTGKDEIITTTTSSYTGVRIIIAQDKNVVLKPLIFTGNMIIVVGVLMIAVSFAYIYTFSRQLARPIRQLKEKMEGIELDNLPEKINLKSSNNEIKALNNSFQRLRERISQAVNKEVKAKELQIQASFDSLQAQVNPHFIYNILNVLANRGIINGDDEICEICDRIASMLRYSTSTLKRTASIEDELEHVANYLMLMKKRFQHRLEYNIDVNAKIYGQTMPKIVLQQIVENCINHGFQRVQTTMRIDIRGYISGGWWYIEIADNGKGFDSKVAEEIKTRMNDIKRSFFNGQIQTDFAIGGMGIVSMYARLMLFYNGEVVLSIENGHNGGAKVTIGSTIKPMGEVPRNVQNNFS